MSPPPPRFDVSPDDIDRVVSRFYARVRREPVLGPVFAGHVQDWPAHEAKIAKFWRNAILHERAYQGSPMMAHRQAGDVRGAHFPIWLALFEKTLTDELAPAPAAAWAELAHRIGQGLRLAVEDMGLSSTDAPLLR
jgi:hemoglobin